MLSEFFIIKNMQYLNNNAKPDYYVPFFFF